MARKEKQSGKWIKSERVGNVTLFLTKRSPFWWMYWTEGDYPSVRDSSRKTGRRPRERFKSTRETDLALARLMATRKNDELFKQRAFPETVERKCRHDPIESVIVDFVAYLQNLDRSHDYIRNIKSRLLYLAQWMSHRELSNVQDVTPRVLSQFAKDLRDTRKVKAATINDYLDAVHCFFGYVIFKRRLVTGPNPAATGRQAELDRFPENTARPPTIYPDQINAIIEVANKHFDRQIANLVVFVCEGGFRFQELQFLQVGDINLAGREIVLDVKRPNLTRVRPELQRRCLSADGLWIPKSRAGRRPVHVTDRLATVIQRMGLGEPSDWVFVNQAGNQIAENKTLQRLKKYALEGDVLVETHPSTGKPWSRIKWHWLRHFHRTRAHACKIRRDVSKVAMGHAGDSIHDHYRGLDSFVFHEEYEKFDSGIDDALLRTK